MKLTDQLKSRELIVFLGTGGVGKTTIAAAAALEASQTRKTLVLTIDPAKRLADSLGMKLGNEIVEVTPNLHARMLDTRAALDALIARYAPSPETMNRIFQSRFYQELGSAFIGSEEFVAMGALHDILQDGDYDLVIVDTPPSKHAVDFLNVNQRLIRVFDSGVVKYLFKPTRLLRVGGGYAASILARWTSREYLEEFGEFVMTFDEMFKDMESRVRTMQEVFEDASRTSLNLVTATEVESVSMARALYTEVTRDVGLPVSACVVNRYYPRLDGMATADELTKTGAFRERASAIVAEHAGTEVADAEAFLEDAVRAAGFYEVLAREHDANIEALKRTFKDVDFSHVPNLPTSVHDMAGLEEVGRYLRRGA